MPVVAPPSGLLSGLMRRSGGAEVMPSLDGIAGLPEGMISALEARAVWAKYGF
jgi:serine protease SohB